MSHSRSPWRYNNVADKSGIFRHPLQDLPLWILNGLVPLDDSESPQGLGGINSYFNHFMQWEGPVAEGASGGWLLSGVTGTATVVLTNVRNGEIALTADATANCDPTLQLGAIATGASFGYVVGKRMWVFARLKMLTVASTEFFFGLGTPDTEPTVTNGFPSDGIFFHKASADTKLSFDARKDGVSTSKATISGTLVDATYTTIGFAVDVAGNIIPYQDGSGIAAGVVAVSTANIPSATVDVLQFMLGFRGASQVVTLDWLAIGQEN